MNRFHLEPRRWYAAELIGEEFGSEIRSYSPIRVDEIRPKGGRRFSLAFYHANYPEGARDKVYELETIERSATFILARSREHSPTRLMLIYFITIAWLREHFGASVSESEDVQAWFARNA
ncbi:MAG: hypothetical protein A2133_08535 [Actinobacteria bacterium RBG_16_64_13]|nr:MAG: hypothetical protein A2133_08535 [Actinobacteria bacterium RBG_16_64_13]